MFILLSHISKTISQYLSKIRIFENKGTELYLRSLNIFTKGRIIIINKNFNDLFDWKSMFGTVHVLAQIIQAKE